MKNIWILDHPADEPLLLLRQWQVEAFGDAVTGGLISYFEYWHSIKLKSLSTAHAFNRAAEMHGDTDTQDTSLLQYHTLPEIEASLLGIGKRNKIRSSIQTLVSAKIISKHRNPSDKYKFDRTTYYLFHPEVVQAYLDARKLVKSQSPKMDDGKVQKGWSWAEYERWSSESEPAITETTPKTSPKEMGDPPPPEPEPTLPAKTDRTPESDCDSEPRSNSTPVKSGSLCAKPESSSENSGDDDLCGGGKNFSKQNRAGAATSPRHPAARMDARFERLSGQDGAAAHRRACDQYWPGLVREGLEQIWKGQGRLDFEPKILEAVRSHLAQCELPSAPVNCKRYLSNQIMKENWGAIELLMETGEDAIATPARRQPEPIMATVRVDPRFLDKLKPA